jgi:Flp pilus assembly protein TadD
VTGDWPGALAEFQAAEAIDPGNPLYPVSAGIAFTRMNRRDEACAAFRRAALLAGSRPLPLDAAARATALGCPLPAPR